ncbi:OPT oligopeptide transporter protein-domain-containing protein [Lipomyces tetrasporus]
MAIDDVEKRAPLSLSTVAVRDFDSLSNSNSGSIDGTEKKDSGNVSSQYLHDREDSAAFGAEEEYQRMDDLKVQDSTPVINYSSPLVLPFFTTVNRYIGTVVAGIIMLIMFYKNYMCSAYIPPNTADVFDRYGEEYNVSKVLSNNRLDVDLYKAYSPPYISAGNLMSMAVSYMIYTFASVYILLSEWRIIKEAVVGFYTNLRDRQMANYDRYNDPISVMMRSYPEVPDWWF